MNNDELDETRKLGMEMLEGMEPILETLDGFKSQLAKRGYSETAQEQMVVAMFCSMVSGANRG